MKYYQQITYTDEVELLLTPVSYIVHYGLRNIALPAMAYGIYHRLWNHLVMRSINLIIRNEYYEILSE